MAAVKIICWEEDCAWLGYLQDFPDYWTQGESLDDLKEHLRDLYRDLPPPSHAKPQTCGETPR
jgi:hypothetical protein